MKDKDSVELNAEITANIQNNLLYLECIDGRIMIINEEGILGLKEYLEELN